MGLDVYLYRYDDRKNTEKREARYSEFSENLWKDAGDYDSIPQEKKDEINAKEEEFALSLGLDKYGDDKTGKECIELPSTKYPEHYFKIGYLRSSYNEGGIDRVLGNFGLPRLDEIFGASDNYCFQPNWQAALSKLKEVHEQLKAKGDYRCFHYEANIFEAPKVFSEKEAMEVFNTELTRKETQGGMDAYSNKLGEFHLKEPLEVVAVIPGFYKLFNEQPCVYVVTKGNNDWYLQALEVAMETCEFVLSKNGTANQYYLHWSS